MAQYTDPGQLDGLFKNAYGDSVEQLTPEASLIQKEIDFVPQDKETGDKYNQPVVLAQEHGVTYAAAGAGAFALNESVAMTMKNAELQGSQLLIRSALSYDAAAKAANSKKAFVKGTELLVETMVASISKRLELSLLYGQSETGIGQPASTANVNATSTTITISNLTWATGIWAGLENSTLDLYNDMDTTPVKINTNAALVVSSVNLDSKTVTVTGNATDITAIDALTYGGNEAMVFEGAQAAEMAGIDKIITNTGTLFGINAGTYNLWKGNNYSASSADLTIGKILKGMAQAVGRGLDERVNLYVAPVTWENLNDDIAALRRLDSSYKASKVEQGNEAITYHGQNGMISVYSHLYMKEGEAFALPSSKCRRVGAQDISFKSPAVLLFESLIKPALAIVAALSLMYSVSIPKLEPKSTSAVRIKEPPDFCNKPLDTAIAH